MPLPPTGLQQQTMSLMGQAGGIRPSQRTAGKNPQQIGAGAGGAAGMAPPPQQAGQPMAPMGGPQPGQQPGMPMGTTNLSQLAKTLAQGYGLPLGRQELVDPSGNITMTPDQIVAASGGSESLGSAAAKLNYISAAIAREQNNQQAQKAEASLQAGLGLVRSRGRGSAAAMQSGFYQNLASLYDNQEHEAADFSYFILKEQMDFQRDMMRRAERLAKKRSRFGGIGGILGAVGGALLGGLPGAGLGAQLGGGLGAGWF